MSERNYFRGDRWGWEPRADTEAQHHRLEANKGVRAARWGELPSFPVVDPQCASLFRFHSRLNLNDKAARERNDWLTY
jgi:hypothetical protein